MNTAQNVEFWRQMMPVLEIWPQLQSALSDHPVVILQAPPGAGKSTVLPLKLVAEPWMVGGKAIMLEPRRLAARSVATRLASSVDEQPGETFGYRVRLETRVSSSTRLEVVTEGILTRMIQQDPTLEGVNLLIFDEFHERSIHADLALALAVHVQTLLRPDLKILIMSATLDLGQLTGTFPTAPVILSSGRTFPVDVRYLPRPSDENLTALVVSSIRKAWRETEGDILVFLPGAGEIRSVAAAIEGQMSGGIVRMLYGELPFSDQQAAIVPDPHGQRRVVLSTSIAETSLTIEGVTTVIDAGLARLPRFDPRSGLTRLETIRVSLDAADQRAGRAGRTAPGVCYRLWTEGMHRSLVPRRVPEILEADLATLMLELAAWGVLDVQQLTWVTVPPPGAVAQATELLKLLEALDEKGITARGKEMSRLPVHPRLAHMLLVSVDEGLVPLASDIAALLEERDPAPRDTGADIAVRLDMLEAFRAGRNHGANRNALERIDRLALQYRKWLNARSSNAPSTYDAGRLLAAAFPERVARQQTKQGLTYTMANGRVVQLPDHDPLLHESWICAPVLDAGTRGMGKIFLAAAVDPSELDWLTTESNSVAWDDDRQMIVGTTETRVGSLVVTSRPMKEVSDDDRAAVWEKQLRVKGLDFLPWSDEAIQLRIRIQCLAVWRREDGWPDFSDSGLLVKTDEWFRPFVSSIHRYQDLQRLNIHTMLLALLSWDQQKKMDALVPEKIEVPSGSFIKVVYRADGSQPVLEVRLQELFGMPETPRVNDGKVPLLLHLLSPGYKPVQVTQDLHSFWNSTYHEVKKELKRRYPKHSWPEDPWTATAVRGAVRRKG